MGRVPLLAPITIVLIIFLAFSNQSIAAIPNTISYEGYLATSSGTPVNGNVSLTFSIYDAATAGTILWAEAQNTVTVNNGAISVALGSVTPINLPFDAQYYLGIKVNSDLEMTPRQALSSVPTSFRATMAESAATLSTVCTDGQVLHYVQTSNSWSCANPVGLQGPIGPQGIQGTAGPAGASPFALNSSDAVYTAGSVGIGTNPPDTTAALDVSSTTKGFLAPRMTTVLRLAIVTPANGLLVYDTDQKTMYVYDSTGPGQWNSLGSGNVSGAVLTNLAGIPAGAGVIPSANLPAESAIGAGVITNANVSATAAIDTSKLSGAITSITGHGLGWLATKSTIADADLAAGAAIADSKLATIATVGKVSNSATTATSAAGNNSIVSRDGSGNFAAGTITATTLTATDGAARNLQLVHNGTNALISTNSGNIELGTTGNLELASGVGIAASNWSVSASGMINGSNDGIGTKVVAGPVIDGSFTSTPFNGLTGIDSTTGRIYYRYGGVWHYTAQTGGFQIPNYEVAPHDQLPENAITEQAKALPFEKTHYPQYLTTKMQSGDLLIPYADTFLPDGSVHGLYARFDDVKGVMLCDVNKQLESHDAEIIELRKQIDELKQLKEQPATANNGQNRATGTAKITTGNKERNVFVKCDTVRFSSKIFMTPKVAIAQALAVTEIKAGVGFVVSVKNRLNGDVPFDWMIEE